MSDKTTDQLAALASADIDSVADEVPIWDASASTTKKATVADLVAAGGGGGSGITSPLDIPGCVLWLDASDATTINAGSPANNDPVSLWADKSGNGYDAAQATADNQPTYKTNIQNGLGAIRFDSSVNPAYLALSGAGLSFLNGKHGVTLVCLAGRASTSSQLFNVATDSGNARRAYLNLSLGSPDISDMEGGASNDDSVDGGTIMFTSIGSNTINPVLAAVMVRADLIVPDVNAQANTPNLVAANGTGGALAITPGPFPNTDAFSVQIGGDNTAPGPGLISGDIYEIVAFDRAVHAGEARQLLEYLSAKWALL